MHSKCQDKLSLLAIDQLSLEQVRQLELQAAERLLADLVAFLPHLTTADELDMRMQGKLDLLLQLIHVLGSRCLASTDSQQLVHLLLTGMLWIMHMVSFRVAICLAHRCTRPLYCTNMWR